MCQLKSGRAMFVLHSQIPIPNAVPIRLDQVLLNLPEMENTRLINESDTITGTC